MQCMITKEIKWHMGHRVPNHKSKCRSMHGHTYRLIAHVAGQVDETAGTTDEGMVMDFGDIKTVLIKYIYDPLDHATMLWEKDSLVQALREDISTRLVQVTFIPTAENIAKYCFDVVEGALFVPNRRQLAKIVIFETPTSSAEYSRVRDKAGW